MSVYVCVYNRDIYYRPRIKAYISMRVCMNINKNISVYTHTHTHIYIYIYIYIYIA